MRMRRADTRSIRRCSSRFAGATSSKTPRLPWRSSSDGQQRVSFVSTEAIVTGLTECEWPARLEWLLVPDGELLIDAAHNPAGAQALASYLRDTGSPPLPIVFAAMADKDLHKMIAALAPVASSFIATTVPHARARTAEQLAAEIRALLPYGSRQPPRLWPPSPRALELSSRAVACGSIYMIGPLRARLLEGGASRT